MKFIKKKILVTGAAGFLGSHLSEKLGNLGHDVIGIDNMIGGYEDNVPKNIEFHKFDCCDFEKIKEIMKSVNIVYHCAATAHEGLSVFSPFEITKNNIWRQSRFLLPQSTRKLKELFFVLQWQDTVNKKHLLKKQWSLVLLTLMQFQKLLQRKFLKICVILIILSG